MTVWRGLNTFLYRIWYGLRHRRVPAPSLSIRAGEPAVLCLAWGRIGDAILFTGALKHFRRAFEGCRVVYAGRPEVEAVVLPHVDEFVPLGAPDRLARPYAAILTDPNFFHGGVHALGGLLEALPAQRKLVYEGYELGAGLAPLRVYPDGAEVVPALRTRPHLLDHGAHYFREAMRRLETGYAAQDFRPVLEARRAPLDTFGLLPGAYVAWQPSSNNRKKDYPDARWREVLDAFPDVTFVALGTRGSLLRAGNVLDLRGRTSLPDALGIIAACRAFLGPDSGLTHAAAVLGVPAVCVAQMANLRSFFPYPEEYGFRNLVTVENEPYRSCARCFMTCSREPIVATWLLGAKCVRTLPAAPVVDALRERLSVPVRSRG